ncbi:hypothetical protein QBC46DRAFT_442527 [Diplogelasinospora grovesii]|uniref:DUF3669 domain-containing protein n=1 Tax=Diplogelasinospora grovesii TaxID=303347 RepID=A0AAN6S1M6_9PEZI|nr:hypothetical protein QBC46DRAFT_442527 [Diplogelasinospora grovesii]
MNIVTTNRRRRTTSMATALSGNGGETDAQTTPPTKYYAAVDLQLSDAKDVMRRCLTPYTVILTPSSYGLRRKREEESKSPEYRRRVKIGEGRRGAIFETMSEDGFVMKKEHPSNKNMRFPLAVELQTYFRVAHAFSIFIHNGVLPGEFLVPHGAHPTAAQGAQHRSKMVQDILREPTNKHCLVRVCLGSGKQEHGEKNMASLLRDFPLDPHMLERLGKDGTELAALVGEAFAVMHWGACIDAEGVKFVLGTAMNDKPADFDDQRLRPKDGDENCWWELQYRAVTLYVINFGRCSAVDLGRGKDEVYRALRKVMVNARNSEFNPIPDFNKTQPVLYEAFKTAYIEKSNEILTGSGIIFATTFCPKEFLDEYETVARSVEGMSRTNDRAIASLQADVRLIKNHFGIP